MTQVITDAHTDSETCDRLANYYSRFIVGLCIVTRRDGVPREDIFTCFLFGYRGLQFILTAGHVAKILDEVRQDADVEFLGAGIIDGCPIQGAEQIPVTYDMLSKGYVDSGEADLAVISLPDNTWDLIAAHGGKGLLTPSSEASTDITFTNERHYVIGIPDELEICTFKELSPVQVQSEVSVSIVCLPVRPLNEDCPENCSDIWRSERSLLFTISGSSLPQGIRSIKGMSGGPVIRTYSTAGEKTHFKVVGIQSSWLPKQRLLCATKISTLTTIIDKAFESHSASE